MKNHSKNALRIAPRTALLLSVLFAAAGCAQKPVLPQLDSDAPETAINSPAQAEALKKMHAK